MPNTPRQKQYFIFDTAEDREPQTLRITSNKNIREVCQVCVEAAHLSNDERMYYAQHGEIKPDDTFEKDGRVMQQWSLQKRNKYMTPGVFFAGLAEHLFYDCPEMLTEDANGKYQVKDDEEAQKLFDGLIRERVWEAFCDFLSRFSLKPYEGDRTSGFYPSDLRGILQELTKMPEDDLNQIINDMLPAMKKTQKNGGQAPQADSTHGNSSATNSPQETSESAEN